MKKVKVVNKLSGEVICSSCNVADNFLKRFKGLMGKKELAIDEGLLIKPCKSIHMFFMRFKIDLIFLDSDQKVIEIIEGIKPWKISPYIKNSDCVLELPYKTIRNKSITLGTVLNLSPL